MPWPVCSLHRRYYQVTPVAQEVQPTPCEAPTVYGGAVRWPTGGTPRTLAREGPWDVRVARMPGATAFGQVTAPADEAGATRHPSLRCHQSPPDRPGPGRNDRP
ncbi:hypothetical protein GCM10010521_03050 [Streptomyces rameus]|uniref:Uncharacterized protein n=1 Tax=Streptomyces rameus TaxID=68261 RepID=A0ABP6MLV9_9ACTN